MGNPRQGFAHTKPSANQIPNGLFGGQPAKAMSISRGLAPFENWNDIYSFVDNVS